MSDGIKNPYDDELLVESRVFLSRKACWIVSVIFLVLISGTPIWRHLAELTKPGNERWLPVIEFFRPGSEEAQNLLRKKKSENPDIVRESPSLRDHLQAFEDRVKGADFRKALRRSDQARQLRLFHDGNNRVVVGRDGWLYFRPSVEALTGYGPIHPEPDSVMKDPDRGGWHSSAGAVERFAAQLKERDIDLVLVPVPVKAMIRPEGISGSPGPVVHPDYAALLDQFRKTGVTVVDLLPVLMKEAESGDAFLHQDTHWTVPAMRLCAKVVANQLAPGETETLGKEDITMRESMGDLVGMLDLPDPARFFQPETQEVVRVLDEKTGVPLGSDPESDMVLLGDSFVNIYDDPGLGFGEESSEARIGGGFGSNLARALGRRLHIFAINGEGANGVRQAFAALPDNVVRSKKTVVWVIAARDLIYSESSGRKAGVDWTNVTFNAETVRKEKPKDNGEAELILTGVVKEKSFIEDPTQTPYTAALFSVVFDSLKVEKGTYDKDEALVFLWAFRDRKLSDASKWEVGSQYRLKLRPLEAAENVQTIMRLDDLFRVDLMPFFGEPSD